MIVEARKLTKRFGGRTALRGFDLQVAEGSAYALIGSNGAGKSTTIRILLNLLPPDEGEAAVLGLPTRRIGPPQLAQIGYVAESQRLPPHLTVAEYLDYVRAFYPTWDKASEAALLERFRLPQDVRIRHLSHGMRMKLAFAAALPYRPKLLFLDEPFSGIDAVVRDNLLEALLEQAGDTTVFVSSQDLDEIEGLVTHVGYLEDGRLLFESAVEDLRKRFRSVRVILDEPAELPAAPPATWLDLRASGNVLSFVEEDYRAGDLQARISALGKSVRRVETEPQRLRAIFVAVAKRNMSGAK